MSNLVKTLFLAGLLMGTTSARNALDLKNDLASVMPSGMKMRLAYIKGGRFTEFSVNATTTVVYGVDSDDGQIRRIYPASGSGSYFNVSLTADGKRVIFFDKATNRIVVVNWDGTLVSQFDAGGLLLEYWRNPSDNTDWALVLSGGASRVNIDTRTKVNVYSGCVQDDGLGLSDDGKKLMCYCGGARLVDLATGSYRASIDAGGCQPSMRAGTPYQYSHNVDVHNGIHMYNEDGSKAMAFMTSALITTWINANKTDRYSSECTSSGGHSTEGARFSQHRDFATFMIKCSKVNPYLFRLSDQKFVFIEDNLPNTYCGDMDMVAINRSGTSVALNREPVRNAAIGENANGFEVYSFDGRKISTLAAHQNRKPGSAVVLLKKGEAQGIVRQFRAGPGYLQ